MDMLARNAPSLICETWNNDPIKMAVHRAILSCQVRLHHNSSFSWDIGHTLAQDFVSFYLSIFIGCGGSVLLNSFQAGIDLGGTLLSLSRYPDFSRSAVGDVTEENQ